MGAPGRLPFQFQQRGSDLSEALKDSKKYGRYTETRDQDLENYLAGLHGLPPGGDIGQVLTKYAADDYAADWETPSGGGSGFSNDCFTWTGNIHTTGLASGATFDSNSGNWDEAQLDETSGLGVTLDGNGNPVIPAGWWVITFASRVVYDTAPTGYTEMALAGSSLSMDGRQDQVEFNPGFGWQAQYAETQVFPNTVSGNILASLLTNGTDQAAHTAAGIPGVRITGVLLRTLGSLTSTTYP